MRLDDSILVAYVDGELDAGTARTVTEALIRDPEAQEKVRLLRESASLVRTAFEDPAYEKVPLDLVKRIEKITAASARRAHWRIPAALAASIAVAILTFAGGYTLRGTQSESTNFANQLMDEVAEYHVVYARQGEHQVELPADRRDELETWLGRVLHRQLTVPDLSAQGLAFRGGRLLVVEGRPVAQLLFLHPGDPERPLALCVAKGRPGDQPIRLERKNGLNFAYWQSKGFVYVLVGWDNKQYLTRLADELAPILDQG